MKLVNSSLILWLLTASACSTIQVPDVPICRPLRVKTETKVVEGVGKVTMTRGNPVCMKETGSPVCLYCATIGTGKESYVSDDAAHLLAVGGKKKSYTILMREGSVLPVESWAEMRIAFINGCKQFGCTQADIGKWQAKISRFTSIGEALK